MTSDGSGREGVQAQGGLLAAVLAFSIERRGTVLLATLVAAALGAWAATRLPIDALPDITTRQVQINTPVPALSAVEAEKQVTFPIESALAGAPGLESTRSFSRNGFSQVTAVFEDRVDVYFARQQVAERLAEARDMLPAGAEPRMGPIATGLGEIYMWALDFEYPDGKGAPRVAGRPGWQPDGTFLTPEREVLATELERLAWLRTLEDWVVRFQMRSVPGVAAVDVIGGYVKQYQVRPDPARLRGYGLSFQDVLAALARNNQAAGAGWVEDHGEAWQVRATGRLTSLAEIAETPVATRDGIPVRIRDLAQVAIGPELRTGSGSLDGREVVIGTAIMRVGENSRVVARAVGERLEQVRPSLPAGVVARTVLDRSRLVEATLATVGRNLGEGAILVIVVLLLALGSWRAALLTALAIPLSVLLTACGMVGLGVSGNLMSLGAIDFGLIVDGAVIIVENCLRCLAERRHALGRALTAAERVEVVREATQQVRTATAFGEAIIVTVYLPILALTGVEGKIFHPMAITVILALAAAFVLSLTLVPALASLVLEEAGEHAGEGGLLRALQDRYARVLRAALGYRAEVVGGSTVLFLLAALLFGRLGREFVPRLDEHDVIVLPTRIPSMGIGESTRMDLDLERLLGTVPEVRLAFAKTGTAELATDPMPPNSGDCYAILKPREDWPDPRLPKEELLARLEALAERIPGATYELTQPIEDRFNELVAGVRSDVAVKVFGDEFDDLVPTAEKIAKVLEGVPGATDIKVEQTRGLPLLSIDVDRPAIARLGLDVATVQELVGIAIGGREAGFVFEGDRRFDLVVRLPDELRTDLAALRGLPVPRPLAGPARESGLDPRLSDPSASTFVPLSAVARIQTGLGLNQVSRENGKRRVMVALNVRGRDLGSFVDEARRRVNAAVRMPTGCWLGWGGQFENLEAAERRLTLVVPLCFLLILLLLYGTFESLVRALVVFTGVPLGLGGGVVSLWARGLPFSISAGVGFIALSGIAVLNGLVMLTFIDQLRAGGKDLDEAIVEGCLVRLRPVLMTALVASLGFVPMALATGTGAEVQRPLATVVIGGLATSTLLTLVVLPVLYRMAVPKA